MKTSKSLIFLFLAFVLIAGSPVFQGCSGDGGGSGGSSVVDDGDDGSGDGGNGGNGGGDGGDVIPKIQLNFDDGTLQGWTADGLWHITANRCSSSPNSVWYASDAGNYDTGEDANQGSVTSPLFNVGSSASLDFEYFLDNECGDVGSICSNDKLTVEISQDYGSWTILEDLPTADVFTSKTVDLSAFAGKPVRLRFHFDTDDEVDNEHEGAYVDNVVINNGKPLPAVAVFTNTDYVEYDPENTLAEASNLEAGLTGMGWKVTTFTGITDTDIKTAVTDSDILVIPQLETGDLNTALSAAARTAIADFVSGGGSLFVFFPNFNLMDLLNDSFGFSLVGAGVSTPYALNAVDAAGTTFADGPASLPGFSATLGLQAASLPNGSLVIYEENAGTDAALVVMPYGKGSIVFFGWDWSNAAPIGSADGGWLEVLYRAMWVNHYYQIDAVNRGWWNELGYHVSSNNNTWTGHNSYYGFITNSYFVFDLGGITDDIAGGILKLELADYYSLDLSETFSIYDVSTDAATLEADGTGQTAIYNDLATGTMFGSFEVEAADVGSIIEIPLSDGAIDDINTAAGGAFSIGVHLETYSGGATSEGVRFSAGDEVRTHQLILFSY